MSTYQHTDEQLVINYLNGDNSAIGFIHQRYFTKVFYKCLCFTKNKDDAYDFAQEILLRSFLKLHDFRGYSKFSTWLYAITVNYCKSQILDRQKFSYTNIESEREFCDNSTDIFEYEERVRREKEEDNIEAYLNSLSELDKKLVEMKYRFNFSIEDLGKMFNKTNSAVKMGLMRARQKMGKAYFSQLNCA